MQRMTSYALAALCLQLFACSDAIDSDPINEPELTVDEQAALPDGTLDHEHDEAMLVEGAPKTTRRRSTMTSPSSSTT